MSLEVININKSYDGLKALNNISFKLKKGEIVGFLGPNGAGKSTLMKIITSFINQDSGEVIISSINKDVDTILTKSKIGYLSENNPLYNDMKVVEYLNFISQLYKLKNSKKRSQVIIFYRKQEKVCRQSHQNQPYITYSNHVNSLHLSLKN